jgi:hypothetical protein
MPTNPAAFTVSNLKITPSNVDLHKVLTVNAVVTNIGDISGAYQVLLKINGIQVDTKEVELTGQASQTISFTTMLSNSGTYVVDVNGQNVSFTVNTTTGLGNWSIIVIITAFFLGIGLAFLLATIFNRTSEANDRGKKLP